MDFVKMEGLGNDFVVIAGPVEPTPEAVVEWCARHTGIGADGVLTVERLTPERVRMRYWNADGGEVEMCGNGLRCVALLANREGWVADEHFIVESAAGDHPVVVRADGTVRAFVGSPQGFRTDALVVADQTVHPVGIGNPHAVVFVDDVADAPVAEVGPRIGSDPLFPGGTNVEFVEVVGSDRIRVRVWERGVGETMASGTGSAAAAFAARERDHVSAPVVVELAGGVLVIDLDEEGAWMEGPARIVYQGTLA